MKNVLSYIFFTCLISWLSVGILYYLKPETGLPELQVFGMFYMLIPALVAYLLQKFRYKQSVTGSLFISFKLNKWFVYALLLPFLLIFISFLISLLLPDVHFTLNAEGIIERYKESMPPEQIEKIQQQVGKQSPVLFFLLMIVQAFVAGCTINALFAFGEELGWRGYMLYHLKHWSFLKVSAFTGIIWGIWHFPFILQGHNYPYHPIAGVFLMIIFCVLISPLLTYIVIKSKSVIAAAIFHGSINAFGGLPLVYLVGGDDISVGIMGYSGFIAIILVVFAFFLWDKYYTKENIFTSEIRNIIED
jgi:membrane protease YdiL (CAAX protease family)